MTSTATLNFDTLYLSDAGQYSCQVTLTSSQLEGEHTVAVHYTIEFMSKSLTFRRFPNGNDKVKSFMKT